MGDFPLLFKEFNMYLKRFIFSFFLLSNVFINNVMAQSVIEEDIYQVEIIEPIHIYNQKNIDDKVFYTNARHKMANQNSWEKNYADFKNKLQKNYGLSYSVDASILGQRVSPNGKGTSLQFQVYPNITWDIYDGEYGKGSINFAYTPTRYWSSTSAQNLSNRIGVISPINDYTEKSNSFSQLSYTHQFAGNIDWLSLTIGQFPIYNFDGTAYDANQQQNFVNFALSQNATSSYPSSSLGMYFTFNLNPQWQLSIGAQDANNISGMAISANDFGKGEYTSFASISYNPVFKNLGNGEYSLLIYNQPSVEEQPGTSNGYSINMEQNLDETWAIFGRIAGVINSPMEIEQSYVIGGVMNNPFNRNNLDQIGLATAFNKVNKDIVGNQARSFENVIETYVAFGIGNFMTITPDFQLYINPALDTSRNTAYATSIRTTFMF